MTKSYMLVDFYGGELTKIPSCHDMAIYRTGAKERRGSIRDFIFYFSILLYLFIFCFCN